MTIKLFHLATFSLIFCFRVVMNSSIPNVQHISVLGNPAENDYFHVCCRVARRQSTGAT